MRGRKEGNPGDGNRGDEAEVEVYYLYAAEAMECMDRRSTNGDLWLGYILWWGDRKTTEYTQCYNMTGDQSRTSTRARWSYDQI